MAVQTLPLESFWCMGLFLKSGGYLMYIGHWQQKEWYSCWQPKGCLGPYLAISTLLVFSCQQTQCQIKEKESHQFLNCLFASWIFYLLCPSPLLYLEWQPTDSGSKHSSSSELDDTAQGMSWTAWGRCSCAPSDIVQSPSYSPHSCLQHSQAGLSHF